MTRFHDIRLGVLYSHEFEHQQKKTVVLYDSRIQGQSATNKSTVHPFIQVVLMIVVDSCRILRVFNSFIVSGPH